MHKNSIGMLACFALAAGCSQSNPTISDGMTETGGDGTGDSDTGGQTGGDYFPLVDGASYTFIHTLADSTQWNESVAVESADYENLNAFLVTDSADPKGENTQSVLAVQGGAVARVHKEVFAGAMRTMVVDYAPGFWRFDEGWVDAGPGFVEEIGYVRTERDGQALNPLKEDRLQRYTIDALQTSVQVPAGEFDDCVQFTRERLIGAEKVKTFWFCAGVGKVKEVNHTSGNREELLSFDIPL